MAAPIDSTTTLLCRFKQDDSQAFNQLIERTNASLRRLARRMLSGFVDLRNQHETDDILLAAEFRLYNAMLKAKPTDPSHFYNLARRHIKWELLDLARKYRGPSRPGNHLELGLSSGKLAHTAAKPGSLGSVFDSVDLFDTIEALPDDEREVCYLKAYFGYSLHEIAEIVGVCVKTVQRRFLAARLALSERLFDDAPN